MVCFAVPIFLKIGLSDIDLSAMTGRYSPKSIPLQTFSMSAVQVILYGSP